MRRSSMLAKKLKAEAQAIENWKQNTYRVIVAIDFIRRCPRRRVPAACITELANDRCYPRREPDGTWSALDTARTRAVLRAYETEQKKAKRSLR